MAKSSYEYNKRSEAKRGIVTRGYKLPEKTVALIKKLGQHLEISQAAVIEQAMILLAEKYNVPLDEDKSENN